MKTIYWELYVEQNENFSVLRKIETSIWCKMAITILLKTFKSKFLSKTTKTQRSYGKSFSKNSTIFYTFINFSWRGVIEEKNFFTGIWEQFLKYISFDIIQKNWNKFQFEGVERALESQSYMCIIWNYFFNYNIIIKNIN